MSDKIDKDKPQPDWNGPALLHAYFDGPEQYREEAGRLCIKRLEELLGSTGPQPVYLVTVYGYWGRGSTPAAAATQCKKAGGRMGDTAYLSLVLNDTTPEVNEAGYIIREAKSEIINIGPVKTLGSLIVEGR